MKKYIIPAIFALALFLRLFDLGLARFWYDESFTALLTRLDIPHLVLATAGDTHPPLYYLVVWLTARTLGTSEAALRLPSVIFSMLSLWLTWRIARKIGLSEPVRMAVLVFMAINPLEIGYAQEARMYALFQALVLWLVLEGLERHWWRIGLAATLTLYTHNYGVFFVPVAAAVTLGIELLQHPVHHMPLEMRDQEAKNGRLVPLDHCTAAWEAQPVKLVLAYAIPLLLFLPWAFVILGQVANISGGYWIQADTGGGALYALYMLFTGFGMPDSWQPLAILVIFGSVIYAVWRRPKRMLLWLSLAPLVLAVLASVIWRPILLFRGLIPSAPFLYLMVLTALVENKPAYKLAYAALLLAPVFGAGLYGYFRYNPGNKGDVTVAIDQVRAEWQPGDVVYHVNDGSAIGWAWYAPDLPQLEMADCGQRNLGALSAQTRFELGFKLGEEPQGRVWVVSSEGPTSTQCEHDSAAPLVKGPPVILVRDDQYVYAGVWLAHNP